MNFVVNPLGSMAAEIVGLDCSRPFADDVLRTVKQEFLDHPVLVFRGRSLSAPQSYAANDIRCRHRVTVAGDRPFFRASATAAA
jgi:alpha-ketoglutarate-dependent taurine dioxygenase